MKRQQEQQGYDEVCDCGTHTCGGEGYTRSPVTKPTMVTPVMKAMKPSRRGHIVVDVDDIPIYYPPRTARRLIRECQEEDRESVILCYKCYNNKHCDRCAKMFDSIDDVNSIDCQELDFPCNYCNACEEERVTFGLGESCFSCLTAGIYIR
jgi:hypothetical protein